LELIGSDSFKSELKLVISKLTRNLEPKALLKDMADRLYNPESLSTDEDRFRAYFDQLILEFSSDYEVWIRNLDFSRFIAAGIIKRSSGVAATVYFQHGGVAISNPLSPVIIERI
jgi:hypothetical protein